MDIPIALKPFVHFAELIARLVVAEFLHDWDSDIYPHRLSVWAYGNEDGEWDSDQAREIAEKLDEGLAAINPEYRTIKLNEEEDESKEDE